MKYSRLLVAVCALVVGNVYAPERKATRSHAIGSAAGNGPVQFAKYQIESAFRTEGVTVFDVRNSGVPNIVTRQYWYEWPPSVSTRHEISAPRTWNPLTEYSDSYADFPMYVDADEWMDFIAVPRQNEDIYWYRNPQGEDRRWDAFLIARNYAGERPIVNDLFGDGQQELVFTTQNPKQLVWAVPGDDPTQPWPTVAISAPNVPYVGIDVHGLGVGDVNGDGRLDLILAAGWFEGPADPNQSPWVFHPENWLPPTCNNSPYPPSSCCSSDMDAYDINGDGLADIICTNPHGRGRWWLQQGPDDTWTPQFIDDDYTESHVVTWADIDGDGIPELITGKRKWAHGTGGEDAGGPAVIYYYKIRNDGGAVSFDRYDIDPERTSGVGIQTIVRDINGDGLPDIVMSNKTGLYYFEQVSSANPRRAPRRVFSPPLLARGLCSGKNPAGPASRLRIGCQADD
jgi:hypothetical protein